MEDGDEEMLRLMRASALKPQDAAFTRRVLGALPPRQYVGSSTRLSLVATTRFAIAMVLLAVAQHWFQTGPGGFESMVVLLLALGPAVMAVSLVCGPLIPRSVRRLVWRSGREWR